ncbi:protein containing OmpA/MotB C-terminal domain [Sulfurimonas gotlandica GD1]|uniref:Protein containing OmpA/MotB C-terminal domain n=1 Tax=Sulfurimonas gotlandica (strain DSM 19862 / JCM 16533 / GD1) TaxID=929558 RepID=B6BGP5_SULGG|nr:OmpA family protein [Sulfurimonas gotlandica]EDZ63206.1 OmpA/MotB [Sulfurimonas gotlandica GD1]EHP29676.1 protein containing OmpA/MotB C-terminal domain [Sulfurimonas gotlandica GD1]
MKKLLLIPALLLGNVAIATDYNFEITPLIGYNVAEGNIDLDNYATFGAEIQYNGLNSIIKPELSVLYSKANYSTNTLPSNADTDVWRVALNGVYEYKKIGSVIPLAKAGIGYETMDGGSYTGQTGNADSVFLDTGVGAKIPFNDMIALKLEALYMLKYNDNRYDNNLAVLAGLNIAFGEKAQKAAPVKEEPAPVVAAVVVDGDDDKDGVLNSVDKCPATAAGKTVNDEGCFIDGDDDNDGVLNSVDACLTTAVGKTVDAKGCEIDGDDDKDGVLNSKDICPNTPIGDAVNSDGCPAKITLHVKFENNSDVVNTSSYDIIEKYADFLNNYSSYSAKIIGYTDSKGSANYNQKLSEKRANAIKSMLLEKGVPADRLSSVGMGESNPVADNSTKEGRAQNRRIEAELTKK